jgi:hypothetical protein
VTTLRKHKYLIDLLALVSILLVQSFAHPIVVLSEVLAPLTMLAVLLVVFTGWRERMVAFAVAAAAITVNVVRFLPIPGGEYHALYTATYHGLRVLFPAFAVAVILRNIFAEKTIAVDQVLGAVCGYLLAGAAWAHVFVLAEILAPGSFSMSSELGKGFSGWHGRDALFYYFSLVTLTTMGYGDVTPVRAPATVLVTLEAIFAQFYLAVVVAQVVGLRLAQAFEAKNPPPR